MRFGTFTAPITQPNQHPTWALERQMELVEWCERIGYQEMFFGEHHNGGWELIGSPEIFIAAAAERTKHLRFGTGVTSLPYHHPFLVAERMVLLDHMTRGRVILGTGPGSLPSDAYYLGLDYAKSRARYAESLEVIMRLLETDEPITMETDWFSLREAQLHLRPYTYPRLEVTAASTVSPTGPKLAGRLGTSLLTIGASSSQGTDVLNRTWEIVEEEARAAGKFVDRSNWRLVNWFHIADTEARAREDCKYGLLRFLEYLGTTSGNLLRMLSDPTNLNTTIDELNASGLMLIGSPEMMVEQLAKLQRETGGFGCYLSFGWEAADREATMHSHELLMRDVAPHFQNNTSRQDESFRRMQAGGDWGATVEAAQAKAAAAYEQEKAASAAFTAN
jgi:limonene 1,2-monooxygenase